MDQFADSKLIRVAEQDPDVDLDELTKLMSEEYGLDNSNSDFDSDFDVRREDLDSDFFDFGDNFAIRGASVRPGMKSSLKSEALRNSPHEKDEFEVWRSDQVTLDTYQKMSHDPQISFGMYLLKGYICGLPYTIECSEKKVRKVTDYILGNVYKDVVRDMLDAIKNGFAFGEKVWQREKVKLDADNEEGEKEIIFSGKIASLEKIKFLDPRQRFRYFKGKNDEISRIEQYQLVNKVSVNAEKILWFALDKEFSGIFGRSRFKNLYTNWYYSEVNRKYLMSDNQKRGSPHLELRYPKGSSLVDEKQVQNSVVAKSIAKKMLSDGIAVLPSEVNDGGEYKWSIRYANTKQSESKSPFIDFLKYQDEKKMKGLGIPPGVANKESNNSNADAQGDILNVNIIDIVSQLESTIQSQLVNQIVDYNFGPEWKSMVKFKIDKSALGRRSLMKEILKTMIRTGTSIEGSTLKSWPDVASMMRELGISHGSVNEIFVKTSDMKRKDGETPVDEAIRDEDSNDTEIRRDGKDERERDRDADGNDITQD